MSTAVLVANLQSELSDPADMIVNMTTVGSADAGVCIRTLSDGKYLDIVTPSTYGTVNWVFIDDGVTIPVGATINNVTLRIRFLGTTFAAQNGAFDINGVLPGHYSNCSLYLDGGVTANTSIMFPALDGAALGNIVGFTSYDSSVMTVNPATLTSWTRAALFIGNNVANSAYSFQQSAATFSVDYVAMVVDYTAATPAWYYNPATNHYEYTTPNPGAPWVAQNPTFSVYSILPTTGSTLGGN